MNSTLQPTESPLPFVLVNMAMTADGKIATANRAISSFGSDRDREQLLALRATADAVMAGARTVDTAAVNLGPGPARYRRQRQARGMAEYNLRVIVSGGGSINPRAEIFTRHFSPILVLTTARASEANLRRLRRVADEVKVFGGREIPFRAALGWLRARWGVQRLLCEGGGALNQALFQADLVDELHLTICPCIFGGRSAPTIADGAGLGRLANARRFQLKSRRGVGGEVFLVLRRARVLPAGPIYSQGSCP